MAVVSPESTFSYLLQYAAGSSGDDVYFDRTGKSHNAVIQVPFDCCMLRKLCVTLQVAFSYNTLVEVDDDALPESGGSSSRHDPYCEEDSDEGDGNEADMAVLMKDGPTHGVSDFSCGMDVAEDWERAYMSTACRLLGEEKSFENACQYKDSKSNKKQKYR